jgi:hypothetical protein
MVWRSLSSFGVVSSGLVELEASSGEVSLVRDVFVVFVVFKFNGMVEPVPGTSSRATTFAPSRAATMLRELVRS